METLPETRRGGFGAWERGPGLQPRQAQEDAHESDALAPAEVRGRSRPTLRADAGGRAPGQRRSDRDLGHHGASLDVGRGTVEPPKKSGGASAKTGAARALRRAGAARRKLP